MIPGWLPAASGAPPLHVSMPERAGTYEDGGDGALYWRRPATASAISRGSAAAAGLVGVDGANTSTAQGRVTQTGVYGFGLVDLLDTAPITVPAGLRLRVTAAGNVLAGGPHVVDAAQVPAVRLRADGSLRTRLAVVQGAPGVRLGAALACVSLDAGLA